MAKYNSLTPEIIATLTKIVGSKYVISDPEKMDPYSRDEETDPRYQHMPEIVLLPETAEQIAEIVKLANKELVPVVARGGGTGLAAAAVPLYGGIVISTERMNRVLEINTDSMYMVVQPGVRTDDVQKAAREKGLFYAGDPCSGDSCFIGGNVATNAGGNRAIKYGTTRHQVYGMKIVSPQGKILNLGGRLEKSTTGYALDQLFMGSEGTLGIATEITLKLKPMPHNVIDLLAIFPDIDSAIGIVTKVIKAGITPTCVEFMDNGTIRSVEKFLNEKLPESERGHYIIIQVEGKDEDDLDDKSVLLDELCMANKALSVLVADPQKIWHSRKAFLEAARAESLIQSKEDMVVPVDQIANLMNQAATLSAKYNMVTRIASHAGDGNVHFHVLKGDMPDDQWDKTLEEFQKQIYTLVYQLGGKLSGEHGIGYKRRKLMEQYTPPEELEMMRAIKKALDPNLILNPGKIFEMP
ncbi:FAD-binding oxidoreductase [Acetonema longum]|uniref:FAD linked oxidase domain protein n=1 Tax=Acetonema longum DSM 6540 TaxID=1009370 RepID=F7NIL4_9FIRM|nr:FAD-binding oxidoreductase [Acetonema longum]EGO64118.1 FAD linked oxidase domain protein [Acetonema longum DSM 6540]